MDDTYKIQCSVHIVQLFQKRLLHWCIQVVFGVIKNKRNKSSMESFSENKLIEFRYDNNNTCSSYDDSNNNNNNNNNNSNNLIIKIYNNNINNINNNLW